MMRGIAKRFSKSVTLALLALSLCALTLPALAQTKPTAVPVGKPAELTPAEVIKRFTERETELAEVWKDYSYKQETRFQALGPANIVIGEFYQLSEFVFNDAGKRLERILRAPQSSLENAGLIMTMEDRNALTNLQPFALTAQELPNYNLTYIGHEKIDELHAYVFDVTPKVMSDPRALKKLKDQKIEGKYFQGRIWVDDQDLQVVKVAGKVAPEFDQRFPKFETYRENIDGRYWFPTYTFGEDTLYFERSPSVKVRLVVKYKEYRQFQSDVKITAVEGEVEDKTPASEPGKPSATGTTPDAQTAPTTGTSGAPAGSPANAPKAGAPASTTSNGSTTKPADTKTEPEKPKRPRPRLQ